MGFQKATKKKAKLRLCIVGLAGSGKTMTALQIAHGIAGGGKVAVLDTERGSASLYADLFDFDVDELTSFAPSEYIKRIKEAEKLGYAVIVIDSGTHAWSGTGGILEQVDAAQSRGGNKMKAWADATPKHKSLIDAMLQSSCHIIMTLRAKTKWFLDEEETRGGNAKTTVKKGGLGAEQREGMDYEFGVVGIMRQSDHAMIIDKSRCPALADKIIDDPGTFVAETLMAWLDSGVDAPPPQPKADEPVCEPAEEAPADEPLPRVPSRASLIAMIKDQRDRQKLTREAIDVWGEGEWGHKPKTNTELEEVCVALNRGEIKNPVPKTEEE